MLNKITVEDIVKITNAKIIHGTAQIECGEFIHDTRQIKKGDVFVGIKTEKQDGSCYWEEAFKMGGSIAIINPIKIKSEQYIKWSDKVILVVEDTIKALHQISAYKRKLYGKNLKVIAITGSVGKTSTKDMVANVISQKYKTLKTIGNHNNEIRITINNIKTKR